MLITCDQKGCLKSSDAQYDKETGDVICLECGQPIKTVSETMKRVLLSAGQIVRKEERKAFTMGCMNCHANREVVLTEENKTVCGICHKPIKVHESMLLAMEAAGAKLRKIKTEPEPKSKKKRAKKV